MYTMLVHFLLFYFSGMNLSIKSKMFPVEEQKQKVGRKDIPFIAAKIVYYLKKINPKCTWRYKKGVYDQINKKVSINIPLNRGGQIQLRLVASNIDKQLKFPGAAHIASISWKNIKKAIDHALNYKVIVFTYFLKY
jgi:hypothetical protein